MKNELGVQSNTFIANGNFKVRIKEKYESVD